MLRDKLVGIDTIATRVINRRDSGSSRWHLETAIGPQDAIIFYLRLLGVNKHTVKIVEALALGRTVSIPLSDVTSSVSPGFFISTERTSWNSAVRAHCTRGRHNTSVLSKVKCRSIELLFV